MTDNNYIFDIIVNDKKIDELVVDYNLIDEEFFQEIVAADYYDKTLDYEELLKEFIDLDLDYDNYEIKLSQKMKEFYSDAKDYYKEYDPDLRAWGIGECELCGEKHLLFLPGGELICCINCIDGEMDKCDKCGDYFNYDTEEWHDVDDGTVCDYCYYEYYADLEDKDNENDDYINEDDED